MRRTKVLLALGQHSSHMGKAEMPADKRFFRKAVGPLLNQTFMRNRKAAVIFEATFFQDAVKPTTEDLEAYRRGKISQLKGKIKASFFSLLT